MPTKRPILAAATVIGLCGLSAQAAEIAIHITDRDGDPAANAVVTLMAENESSSAASPILDAAQLVDQREETFVPLVTVVPRGGAVRFANSDAPLHQVYSFSPIRQFELTLAPGETSEGIVFDEVGVAAIGCNIHDHMIAYIFVTDSPWTVVTDDQGRARVDVPAGNYTAEIWHPRLPPATDAPRSALAIGDAEAVLETSIELLPDRSNHRTHGGRY